MDWKGFQGNEAGGRFLFAAQFGLPCKKKGAKLKPGCEFMGCFFWRETHDLGNRRSHSYSGLIYFKLCFVVVTQVRAVLAKLCLRLPFACPLELATVSTKT